MEQPIKGSYVRVIKDGDDGTGKNKFYRSEIWQVSGQCSESCLYADKDGMRTKMAWRACVGYEQECEPLHVIHQLPIFN